VALVVPAVDETDLRWQALANFCYHMTTDTGMTGSAYGPVGHFTAVLYMGAQGAPASPSPSMRQDFAAYFSRHHVTVVIIIPVSPSDPVWQTNDQRQVVAWFTRFLREGPARVGKANPYYVWRHIPPVTELATGRLVRLRP
jgi:hypothetical protein